MVSDLLLTPDHLHPLSNHFIAPQPSYDILPHYTLQCNGSDIAEKFPWDRESREEVLCFRVGSMIEQYFPLHLGVHGNHGTYVSNYPVSEQSGPRYFDVALPRRFRLCRLVALRHPSHSPLMPFLSCPLFTRPPGTMRTRPHWEVERLVVTLVPGLIPIRDGPVPGRGKFRPRV